MPTRFNTDFHNIQQEVNTCTDCLPSRQANVVHIEQQFVPYYANNIQSLNVTPACSDDQEIDTLNPEIVSPNVL